MGSSRRTNGTNNDTDRKPGCPIPLPAGCIRGLPVPTSFEDGVKMQCSNAHCPYQDQLMHPECFHALEDNLVKIMSNLGSARGWTDAQRRANLWDKKGLTLIQRKCRCLCGLGLLRLDETAMFLANKSAAAALPAAPAKTKKAKKNNLPKLNFGNGNSNITTAHIEKHYTKRENKKRNIVRSISPSDSSISLLSSITTKFGLESERRSASHTLQRGKWCPETRNTKSEYGWKKQKSSVPLPTVTEIKSPEKSTAIFHARKFDGTISYAEATLVKGVTDERIINECHFPRFDDAESQPEMQSLSFCTAFSNLQIRNFDVPRSLPHIDSVNLSTNSSTFSLPYDDLPHSLRYSVSSDDTVDSKNYYHYDSTGFFVGPVDLSLILPSPPETPSGSLSFTDETQVTTVKDDVLDYVTNESTGYYDLFTGYSFRLGEILIAERYLPGLL